MLVVFSLGTVGLAGNAGAATSPGRFVVKCGYSHSATDDPIVFPGQPGASHRHDFYGARTTNANSTLASLQASVTTCADPDDTAAYWQPTLYVNGVAQVPTKIYAYYYGDSTVQPHPSGLKIVAGNANATAFQSDKITYWGCGSSSTQDHVTYLPQCLPTEELQAHVKFPECWNGTDLDSPDHKSHMAYTGTGDPCPAGFPVKVPRLVLLIVWNIAPDPATVTLASGGPQTMHADYWNSWNQAGLVNLVTKCLNANMDCGKVTGPK